MRLLLLSLYQEVGSLCQVEQTQEDQQELKKTLVMVSIKKWAGRTDTGGPVGTEINISHGLYQEVGSFSKAEQTQEDQQELK